VRGESENLLAADREIIGIAEQTGCEVLISHLKAIGKAYWGDAVRALHLIEEARRKGLQVWADQYPYEATSTKLSVLTPDWAQEGEYGALTERLRSASLREQILAEIKRRMDIRGGPACVRISTLKAGPNTRWIGHTIADLAADRNCSGEEAVRQLLAEERASVRAVYFSLGLEDLETIMKSPIVAVCSDAPGVDPQVHGAQNVHPRAYGSSARVLGKYVREKKLLPMKTAVWKMTGLPARIFHIPGRGQLRPGFAADISVFDPEEIRDTATYENPHQYAVGVRHVWVNGVEAVRDGRLTGQAGGRVLRKPVE
jgi:N-acyl-D-amino-acid deacylase